MEFIEVTGIDAAHDLVGFQDQNTLAVQRVGVDLHSFIAERDADGYGRSLTGRAFDFDGAVHGLDQLFHDAHAEPRALDLGDRGRADAFERLKNPFQKRLAHADAVVAANERKPAAVVHRRLGHGYVDLPAVVGVLDGVIDDVHIDLPQAQRVAVQAFHIDVFGAESERVLLLSHLRLYDGERFMQQITEREHLLGNAHFARVDARHVQYVVD